MKDRANNWIIVAAALVGIGLVYHKYHTRHPFQPPVIVRIETRTTCGLGLLDALDMDLHYGDEKDPVLVSLETQNPRDPSASHTVSRKDFEQMISLMLSPPPVAGPFTLYLCRDSAHQGKCSSKKKATLTQIIVSDTEGSLKDTHFTAPDRIYYAEELSTGAKEKKVLVARHGGICK